MVVNFSNEKKSPFNIKSESSYNANLSNGSLELGLKKTNCIAWVDMPDYDYQDHIIEAKMRLKNLGSYAATGIIFRIDETSYYMALVSSKGYFRLDLVKDSAPKTLIAWTEISDFNGTNISMTIITYGTQLIFLINDKWLGETNDNSVAYGSVGFVLASYPENSDDENDESVKEETKDQYVCKAMLDYISIDTRIKSIEESFNKWTDDSNINAEWRLRLAETFAIMDEPIRALDQITKAWKRRDEVISTVSATTGIRTKRELLLAARLSFRTGRYDEADDYLDQILDQWPNSAEGKFAYTEKLKVLNELNKFTEINKFIIENPFKFNKDVDYYTVLARSSWELKNYAESAEAWDKAFELTKENGASSGNGVYAANAANAHESAGKKKNALLRYISAGKIFLNQDNMPELSALMPKVSALGARNWEARALAGKWAFSIEDYKKAAKEFETADKLRCALKPRPKADPALYYLWGLVFYINGKNKPAVKLLEKAIKLAPDYELFRAKLEEIKQAGNA